MSDEKEEIMTPRHAALLAMSVDDESKRLQKLGVDVATKVLLVANTIDTCLICSKFRDHHKGKVVPFEGCVLFHFGKHDEKILVSRLT